jgi:hypothetical protein
LFAVGSVLKNWQVFISQKMVGLRFGRFFSLTHPVTLFAAVQQKVIQTNACSALERFQVKWFQVGVPGACASVHCEEEKFCRFMAWMLFITTIARPLS